jgi:hypothetical protein
VGVLPVTNGDLCPLPKPVFHVVDPASFESTGGARKPAAGFLGGAREPGADSHDDPLVPERDSNATKLRPRMVWRWRQRQRGRG